MLIIRRQFLACVGRCGITACAGLLACAGGCREKAEEKSPPTDPTKPVRFTAKLLARGKGHDKWPTKVAVSLDGKTAVTNGGAALRFSARALLSPPALCRSASIKSEGLVGSGAELLRNVGDGRGSGG